MLKTIQIPALTDNYIYLLRDVATKTTAVVDPTRAAPVISLLQEKGWTLDFILNTHHHWDHTDGNLELKQFSGCEVIGFEGDQHRIPGIDREVKEGDSIQIGEEKARVLEIPGHTLGHIAFYFQNSKSLFCGDTVFSIGCGRLFEGTPDQMFKSLQKISQLPDDTVLYCAHEYTEDNLKFAIQDPSSEAVLPELKSYQNKVEQLRSQNQPTVPVRLESERHLNPFLRAQTSEEFARLRRAKDSF